MKKPVRLNAMTERLLTSNGYLVDWVESFNFYGGVANDFLGFGDCIATSPATQRTAAIQVTTRSNKSARRKKILRAISAYLWILSGREIWLITWKRTKENVFVPDCEHILELHFSHHFRKKAKTYWELKELCAHQDIRNHKTKTVWIDLRSKEGPDTLRLPGNAHSSGGRYLTGSDI